MKLQDLMFKISSHTLHNKYYYFDFEEFNPYGNLSIQIDTDGNYPDIITHLVLNPEGGILDFLKPDFKIINDAPHYILIGLIEYVFTYFLKDYRSIK